MKHIFRTNEKYFFNVHVVLQLHQLLNPGHPNLFKWNVQLKG